MTGRGAWSSIGMSNGSVIFEYIPGKTLQGSEPNKGSAFQAVNLGIRAIQKRINEEGYAPNLIVDGVFGKKSAEGVKWYQAKNGLGADGQAGVKTCTHMWRKYIVLEAAQYGVDPKWLFGQCSHESTFAPHACGYYHEADRGINQINTETYPAITYDLAHDPSFSMDWAAKRFKAAMDKFSGKSTQLQIDCAILSHNSPVGAETLYRTGKPGTAAAADYVSDVRQDAEKY